MHHWQISMRNALWQVDADELWTVEQILLLENVHQQS